MFAPIRRVTLSTLSLAVLTQLVAADPALLTLGPADEVGFSQPRIAVHLADTATGQSLGPDASRLFLLDTGANSIVAFSTAVAELKSAGYQTEGTLLELGIGGFLELDVSAEYRFDFGGTDLNVHTFENVRVLSSDDINLCPLPDLCSFHGVAGMPTMDQRVTSLDITSIGQSGGGPLDVVNVLLNSTIMGTTFENKVPSTNLRRMSVPVTPMVFEPNGDGPLPIWADLPGIDLTARHQGSNARGSFVLDTGAQISLISSEMAFSLGLDENGNGQFEDESIGAQTLLGVGGEITAPVLLIDEVRLPTEQGVEMIFTDAAVAVVDIDPKIDGIFGMNFLSSGALGDSLDGLAGLVDFLSSLGLGDLLEDLGLGVIERIGNGSDVRYFDQVHFDFRGLSQGNGRILFDLNPSVGNIQPGSEHGDLDGDFDVDFDDREIWVTTIQNTVYGDSNLDGEFNSSDLVQTFTAGEYEDGLARNSAWATGDWNGDSEFDSSDLVIAFREGAFEAGPQATLQAVPEPAGLIGIVAASLCALLHRRGCRTARAKAVSLPPVVTKQVHSA